MSEENVEIVRQVYDAWNRDDIQWVMDHSTPDSEFWPNPGLPDMESVYRGQSEIMKWWRLWRPTWESLRYEITRIEDFGECLLCQIAIKARGRDSGIDVNDERVHLFDFTEGQISRVRSFAAWDEALEAAGLSE